MASQGDEATMKSVTPGEVVDVSGDIGQHFATTENGHVATVFGRVMTRNSETSIVPYRQPYFPATGDLVVGMVASVRNNMWIVDVGGPFEAILPQSHVPWRSGYGQTSAQMPTGSILLGRILDVDETMRCVVTMKGVGMRRLSQGVVVEVPVASLGRIIGSSGSTIKRLKEGSGCRAIVGSNGRIWIDGELNGINWLRETILMIAEANDPRPVIDAQMKSAPM